MREFWNGRTLRVINNCVLVLFKVFRRGSSETLEVERTRRMDRKPHKPRRRINPCRQRYFVGHVSNGQHHWFEGKGKRRVSQ
ncbi:MAG: hypothetical protein LLF76_03130 [Planctomycetaceae bacterium]|nr:hypothetical protein [Planctomycetaceae bacterium]